MRTSILNKFKSIINKITNEDIIFDTYIEFFLKYDLTSSEKSECYKIISKRIDNLK